MNFKSRKPCAVEILQIWGKSPPPEKYCSHFKSQDRSKSNQIYPETAYTSNRLKSLFRQEGRPPWLLTSSPVLQPALPVHAH